MFIVKFLEWDCFVTLDRYVKNGSLALQLWDVVDHAPVATATTCVQHEMLTNSTTHVAIKNYSENEGMVAALHDAGIIEARPLAIVPTGHVIVPIFALTAKFREYIANKEAA